MGLPCCTLLVVTTTVTAMAASVGGVIAVGTIIAARLMFRHRSLGDSSSPFSRGRPTVAEEILAYEAETSGAWDEELTLGGEAAGMAWDIKVPRHRNSENRWLGEGGHGAGRGAAVRHGPGVSGGDVDADLGGGEQEGGADEPPRS